MCVSVHATHMNAAEGDGDSTSDDGQATAGQATAGHGLESMPAACAHLWLPVDETLMEGYTCDMQRWMVIVELLLPFILGQVMIRTNE